MIEDEIQSESAASGLRGRDDLSRRELLLRGGGLLAGGMLVAACGGSSSKASGGPTATATTASRQPKRGGNLRVAWGGTSPSDYLDAQSVFSQFELSMIYAVFEGLMVRTPDFKLVSNLAESLEPNNDLTEWKIRVKSGIEFHDGKPLTADDVLYSFQRMMTSPTSTATAFLQPYVDVHKLRKLDKYTVQVGLTTPLSIFPEALAGDTVTIVQDGYNKSKQIGTGPFKFVSFAPGQQASFVANKNWWGGWANQKGGPYLDELTLLCVNDDNARVSSLLAGQVDAIEEPPLAQARVIKASPNTELLLAKSGKILAFTMRCDVAPFNDVRVRQALRLIAGRPQIIDQALAGYGRLGNDLYSPDDPLSISATLPQRVQDIEKAKFLLKQAGREGMTIVHTVSDTDQGVIESAQVFAAQAAAAGVKVKVNQIDSATYNKNFLNWDFAYNEMNQFSYLMSAVETDAPGTAFNFTHFHDAQYDKLFLEAAKTTDDAKLREITHEMQMIQRERAGNIIWGFPNTVDAQTSKVTGFAPSLTGHPMGGFGSYATVGFV